MLNNQYIAKLIMLRGKFILDKENSMSFKYKDFSEGKYKSILIIIYINCIHFREREKKNIINKHSREQNKVPKFKNDKKNDLF